MLKTSSAIIISLFTSFFASQAYCEDQVQAWSVATLQKSLNESGSLRFALETQHRSMDELRNTSRMLYRPWIDYEVVPQWRVALGYLYVPTYSNGKISGSANEEHRLWQQILYQHTLWNNPTSYYLRLEQRDIEGKDHTQLRARMFARTSIRIGSEQDYGFTCFEELFFALNKNDSGPDTGFDQNRTFAGGYYTFGHLRLELGYLNLLSKSYLKDVQQTHVVRSALTVNW